MPFAAGGSVLLHRSVLRIMAARSIREAGRSPHMTHREAELASGGRDTTPRLGARFQPRPVIDATEVTARKRPLEFG